MNKQEVFQIVKEKLNGMEITGVEPDSTLQDLDMDSLDAIELAIQLERFLDIKIPDKTIETEFSKSIEGIVLALIIIIDEKYA